MTDIISLVIAGVNAFAALMVGYAAVKELGKRREYKDTKDNSQMGSMGNNVGRRFRFGNFYRPSKHRNKPIEREFIRPPKQGWFVSSVFADKQLSPS